MAIYTRAEAEDKMRDEIIALRLQKPMSETELIQFCFEMVERYPYQTKHDRYKEIRYLVIAELERRFPGQNVPRDV
jgi:hypothetical protein